MCYKSCDSSSYSLAPNSLLWHHTSILATFVSHDATKIALVAGIGSRGRVGSRGRDRQQGQERGVCRELCNALGKEFESDVCTDRNCQNN